MCNLPDCTAQAPGATETRLAPAALFCQCPLSRETPREANHSLWFSVKPPRLGDVILKKHPPPIKSIPRTSAKRMALLALALDRSVLTHLLRSWGRGTFGEGFCQGLASSSPAHCPIESFKPPRELAVVSPASALTALAHQGAGLAQGHANAEQQAWGSWGSWSSMGQRGLVSGLWV